MTTMQLAIARDQLHLLDAGDRIVAIDGDRLSAAHCVEASPGSAAGPVPLVHPRPEAGIEWWLHQDAVARELTVERVTTGEPAAPPATAVPAPLTARADDRRTFSDGHRPSLYREMWGDSQRERAALRRNPDYVEILTALANADGEPVDYRATFPTWTNRAARLSGIIATAYDWCERVRPNVWRITDRGRRALAAGAR